MSGPHVLVVDDDAVLRRVIRASLEAIDADVQEAASGEQALDCVEARAPDLIVLDVHMPGLDGFDVCERLRQLPAGSRIPVLMATGRTDVDSMRRAFASGATDFITKPLSPEILQHRVRFLVRARHTLAELELTAARLERSERRLAEAQRQAGMGSWEGALEENGELEISEGLAELLGLPSGRARLSREALLRSAHEEDRAGIEKALAEIANGAAVQVLEHRIVRGSGSQRWVGHRLLRFEEGDVVRVRGIVQDISERRQAEQAIQRLAFYDSLTGLANRQFMELLLLRAIDRTHGVDRMLAVLFLDLDRFKRVNDSLGHGSGDRLLVQVAERLRRSVRSRDWVARHGNDTTVSRIGGDEFVVVLTDLRGPEGAALVARRLLEAVGQPIDLDGRELRVSTSIGIAMAPTDGNDAEQLVAHADAAMYEAKRRGRNGYAFYDSVLNERLHRALTLESRLGEALSQELLELVYQPIVDGQSREIVKLEALTRWKDSELGSVSPSEFVALAEETGLIVPLGLWAVRTACEQAAAWAREGIADVGLSINVSPVQLREADFVTRVVSIVERTGIDPSRIDLELTEGVFAEGAEVESALQQLKAHGFGLVIDDFGTGYSSLSYLQRMNIDGLKIDRRFVEAATDRRGGAALVAAMVTMAHRLGLFAVAEGVETFEQEDFLRAEGCDLLQGFSFGRPENADITTAQLRAQRSGGD